MRSDWLYIGSSRIDSARRISIPEKVFEYNILNRPNESAGVSAWWAYEITTGVVILSSEEIKEESFNTIGERKIGSEPDNYRITLPIQFFEQSDQESVRSAAQKVSNVQIEPHDELHFLTHEEIISSPPRSIYVLSVEQLEQIIGGHDEIREAINKNPELSST